MCLFLLFGGPYGAAGIDCLHHLWMVSVHGRLCLWFLLWLSFRVTCCDIQGSIVGPLRWIAAKHLALLIYAHMIDGFEIVITLQLAVTMLNR